MRERDERCKRRNILKGALEKIRFFRVCRKNLQGAELLSFFFLLLLVTPRFKLIVWNKTKKLQKYLKFYNFFKKKLPSDHRLNCPWFFLAVVVVCPLFLCLTRQWIINVLMYILKCFHHILCDGSIKRYLI